MSGRLISGAIVCALVGATLSAGQDLTKKEADALRQKVTAVVSRGNVVPAKGKPAPVTRTAFTERELNAYLRADGKEHLPKGVVNPELTIAGADRVSGRAVVDLDAVRKSKERTWLDPASYLTGSVEVKATGIVRTANGKGTFQLESATIGSLPVPKSLLQELVSYYSRTPDTPNGFELDKPFELPANIREVQLQRGSATIIQG